MSEELASRHCEPCNAETPPIEGDAARRLLGEIDARWEIVDDHHLVARFKFDDWSKGFEREDADRDHVRVWGAKRPLEDLLAWESPQPVPRHTEETTDFGRLACRLWWPLLEREATR